jgi:putative Holliday junction resolvase
MITTSLQEFCKYFAPNAPILAIDMGEKKVGLALSDRNRVMAMPLEVLRFDGDKQKLTHILSLIKMHNVCCIVIGLPLNMDGTDSSQTMKVRNFSEKLALLCEQPIYLQDERMTSSAANSLLKGMGMSRKDRHQIDDQVAACMILESVFDNLRYVEKG